jgi:antitoxin component YwqK of YwqJK toxin-antitoxin module
MKKVLLCLILLTIAFTLHAQETAKKERILYIVDNIPIIEDPDEKTGTLSQDDVDELTVVTTKADIEKMGYQNIDKIISIITKELKKRPDELKKLPTTRTMEKKDGVWYLKNSGKPYSGLFIDYFLNGKKEGEGNLNNGKVNGLRTIYMMNGSISSFRNYTDGIANGYSEEYFPNGKLKQKGTFKDGLDDGLWVDYYSTGEIKRQTVFKDKKPQFSKNEEKFYVLFNKGKELMKDENYKSAIKKLDDATKLNGYYSDIYFYRGTAKLDDFDFDGAVVDFDKAIELEPLYMEAISNRAFARIRKYQFKNSRTLSKTSGVTILASKDADLNKGYELGNTKEMMIDAIKEFCQ